MADNRGTYVPLLVIALIFFLSGDPARSPAARLEHQRTLQEAVIAEQAWLKTIQNSTLGDLDGVTGNELNITGFEQSKGYAWESLPKIKERARQHLDYSLGEWGRQTLEGGPEDIVNPNGLYGNATGVVSGRWIRSKLQESVPIPQLNLTDYAPMGPFGRFDPQPFGRNITSNSGDVRISFDERRPVRSGVQIDANITGMSARMTISDDDSNEWKLQMFGVYNVDLGQAVLSTTSEKFAGIFALPQLALSQHTFNTSLVYLNQSLARTIQKQKDGEVELLNPWNTRDDNSPEPAYSTPPCEMILYLQQLSPIGNAAAYSISLLARLERELRFPTGAFVPSAPELHFSFLAFSPDCGYVLESQGPPDHIPQDGNHLVGSKVEVLQNSARNHLLLFTFTLSLQMTLLIRQMREANTPSTRSRISFYTIAMLALGDGFATLSLLLISLLNAVLRLNLIATGFVAFVCVSFFGMRFLMDIWAAQAPERERRAREEAEAIRVRLEEARARLERFRSARDRLQAERLARMRQTETATTETTPSLPGSLPLPVTAPRPTDTGATPVVMPSDQQGLETINPTTDATQPTGPASRLASFGAIYTRFYLLLLITLFLSLHATSLPSPVRRGYFTVVGLLYFSFWIPQINRNIQRNCRHALNWEFVLGQSIVRLVPFAYFYGYKSNVLSADVDLTSLTILATWIWLQIVVLGSQELIGPRWFIRKDWAPPAYDYHPILREDEEGSTMPIGFSEAQQQQQGPKSPTQDRRASLPPPKEKERGKRVFDCAICMQELEVPVVPAMPSSEANSGSVGGLMMARRSYMVTPCRHIFHSACLEGWMKYRLQCPICRETLPSL